MGLNSDKTFKVFLYKYILTTIIFRCVGKIQNSLSYIFCSFHYKVAELIEANDDTCLSYSTHIHTRRYRAEHLTATLYVVRSDDNSTTTVLELTAGIEVCFFDVVDTALLEDQRRCD